MTAEFEFGSFGGAIGCIAANLQMYMNWRPVCKDAGAESVYVMYNMNAKYRRAMRATIKDRKPGKSGRALLLP